MHDFFCSHKKWNELKNTRNRYEKTNTNNRDTAFN